MINAGQRLQIISGLAAFSILLCRTFQVWQQILQEKSTLAAVLPKIRGFSLPKLKCSATAEATRVTAEPKATATAKATVNATGSHKRSQLFLFRLIPQPLQHMLDEGIPEVPVVDAFAFFVGDVGAGIFKGLGN